MAKRNRLMCMVLPLIFIAPTTLTPFPNATQVIEKRVDNKEMVLKKDKFGLIKNPVQEQFENNIKELEKKKAEELRLQIKNELEQKKEPQWQEFIVSFYTGLDEENFANCGGRNCLNKPLEKGMVASNYYEMGTQIYLDNDYGVRVVADTGGKNFNSSNRIDMFVARWNGESKEQWRKRAESYGVRKIRGYIVKE